LAKLAEQVSKAPGLSFPQLAANPSELEATYRFLSNENITWQAVLEPHVQATVGRCGQEEQVVVVHDTSEFSFKTENEAREGIGYLSSGQTGFEAHFALAVSLEAKGAPLGLLGVIPHARAKKSDRDRTRPTRKRPREQLEADRWRKLAVETEQRLQGRAKVVHVMDSEADSYPLFAELAAQKIGFVVRAYHNRYLEDRMSTMADVFEKSESQLFREVPISPRKGRKSRGGKGRANLRRNGRVATLRIKSARIEFPRPKTAQSTHERVALNVVKVYESEPPEDQPPVEWILLTTEPIDTPDAVERVVDIYRLRWKIEEYFKALKTGCAYERRQLMSLHSLLNALALLAPIAWRLLLMRHLAHHDEQRPAGDLISRAELDVLRAISTRVKLGPAPSVQQVLWAIAGLGGHLKNNGPPGWQTIWAGFGVLAVALRAVASMKTSDQS
jgi:hypothetical protein